MQFGKLQTRIVGTYFRKDVTEEDIASIRDNKIILRQEPTNSYDPFAIMCFLGEKQIGYLPRTISEPLTALLNTNDALPYATWIGPNVFDIELQINRTTYSALTNKAKYQESLISELELICENGGVSEVEKKLEEIKESGFSTFQLRNRAEPIISAIISNNLVVLKFLHEFGFKIEPHIRDLLTYAVVNEAVDCLNYLIKLADTNFECKDIIKDAYYAENKTIFESLKTYLQRPEVAEMLLIEFIIEDDLPAYLSLRDYFLNKKVLEEAVLFCVRMSPCEIGRELLKYSYDDSFVRTARIKALHNAQLDYFIMLSHYPISPDDLFVFFKTLIESNHYNEAYIFIKRYKTKQLLNSARKYLIESESIDLVKAAKIVFELRRSQTISDESLIPSKFDGLRAYDVLGWNHLSSQQCAQSGETIIGQFRSIFAHIRGNEYSFVTSEAGDDKNLTRFVELDDLDLNDAIKKRLMSIGFINLMDLLLVPAKFFRSSQLFNTIEVNELLYLVENFDFHDPEFERLYMIAHKRRYKALGVRNDLLEQMGISIWAGSAMIGKLTDALSLLAGERVIANVSFEQAQVRNPLYQTLIRVRQSGLVITS